MFKPSKGSVMVELVEKQQEVKLHIPDTAKSANALKRLVVYAVGDGVEDYAVGDEVLAPLPSESQLAKVDVGDGEKVFIFWKQEDLFGKFTSANKEKK